MNFISYHDGVFKFLNVQLGLAALDLPHLIMILVGLGLLFNWPLWTTGIDRSAMYGGNIEASGLAMDMVIRGDLSATKTAFFALFTWALTVAAAVSVWRSRLQSPEPFTSPLPEALAMR